MPSQIKNPKNEFTFPKSNILALSKSNYTLNEQRIFSLLFWKVGQTNEWQDYYDIEVLDLIEHLDIKSGQYLYQELMNLATGVVGKTLFVLQENEWDVLNIVNRANYQRGQGTLRLYVSQEVQQFLKGLVGNFTIYDLRNFLALKTAIGFKMYDILRSQVFRRQKGEATANFTIDYVELKELMGLSSKYKLYADFKKRVLEPSKKELAEKTDISFDYEELKSGKKVKQILFKISEKKVKMVPKKIEKTEKDIFIAEEGQDIFHTLANRMISYGIKKDRAVGLIEEHGEEYIVENLLIVDKNLKNGKISNVGGYMIDAIEKDYAHSQREQEKHEQEREAYILRKKEEVANQLEREQELKNLYVAAIYKEIRKLTTNDIYKSETLLFKEKANQFTRQIISKQEINPSEFESSLYTRNTFAEYLALKYLEETWHSFEEWSTFFSKNE